MTAGYLYEAVKVRRQWNAQGLNLSLHFNMNRKKINMKYFQDNEQIRLWRMMIPEKWKTDEMSVTVAKHTDCMFPNHDEDKGEWIYSWKYFLGWWNEADILSNI